MISMLQLKNLFSKFVFFLIKNILLDIQWGLFQELMVLKYVIKYQHHPFAGIYSLHFVKRLFKNTLKNDFCVF